MPDPIPMVLAGHNKTQIFFIQIVIPLSITISKTIYFIKNNSFLPVEIAVLNNLAN